MVAHETAAPAAAAPIRKVFSVVPAGWDDLLSAPAPRAAPPKPVAVKPVAEAPAAARPARSLEEMRAELARLRQNAKERHTPVPVKRDTFFEPTDFQELVVPEPPPAPESHAPTVYMDFTALKSNPAGPDDRGR